MLTRKVEHKDWNHMRLEIENKAIAECARIASATFGDGGPWIVSDEHCTHEVLCERVNEWRCVNLRGSAEGV
jgi:hypothetical protein